MRGEKQGITPEQMAQTGSISFMDAIALKQMADRARASAPPDQAQQAQPSVVDELRMQAMQAGRQALPSGGIASLPAPNIGSAAMASGGIVAFNGEQGSAVKGSDGAEQDYSSEFDYLQNLKMQARTRGDFAAVEQIDSAISAALERGRALKKQAVLEPIKKGATSVANLFRFGDTSGLSPAPAAAAAPATAAPPATAAAPAMSPGAAPFDSPFAIERGAMPRFGFSGMPQDSAPQPSSPPMSAAQINELFGTSQQTAGNRSDSGGGGMSLTSSVYKPTQNAISDQLTELRGRKYDSLADMQKAGIGQEAQARQAKIQKELDRLPEDKKFAALMALSEAGFRMAGAASKPGASFLGSAAEGGAEGLKSLISGRKEFRERTERLEDKRSDLALSQEAIKRTAMERDDAMRRGDTESAQRLSIELAKLESEGRKLEFEAREGRANRAAISAKDKDGRKELEKLYITRELAGDKAGAQQALGMLSELTGIDTRALVAQINAKARLEVAEENNIIRQLGGVGSGKALNGNWTNLTVSNGGE
jgi:hypothetical protein